MGVDGQGGRGQSLLGFHFDVTRSQSRVIRVEGLN